ncbi:hypothetical protein, partial [Streptomyces sp. NPDC002082]|uniref:hypothetical protein n=1 Tax=Streptomyces sp. NPDC002082 TaxID=3154772 RepID=UPI00331E7E27
AVTGSATPWPSIGLLSVLYLGCELVKVCPLMLPRQCGQARHQTPRARQDPKETAQPLGLPRSRHVRSQ